MHHPIAVAYMALFGAVAFPVFMAVQGFGAYWILFIPAGAFTGLVMGLLLFEPEFPEDSEEGDAQ